MDVPKQLKVLLTGGKKGYLQTVVISEFSKYPGATATLGLLTFFFHSLHVFLFYHTQDKGSAFRLAHSTLFFFFFPSLDSACI